MIYQTLCQRNRLEELGCYAYFRHVYTHFGYKHAGDSSDGTRIPARLVFNSLAFHRRALAQQGGKVDGELTDH